MSGLVPDGSRPRITIGHTGAGWDIALDLLFNFGRRLLSWRDRRRGQDGQHRTEWRRRRRRWSLKNRVSCFRAGSRLASRPGRNVRRCRPKKIRCTPPRGSRRQKVALPLSTCNIHHHESKHHRSPNHTFAPPLAPPNRSPSSAPRTQTCPRPRANPRHRPPGSA